MAGLAPVPSGVWPAIGFTSGETNRGLRITRVTLSHGAQHHNCPDQGVVASAFDRVAYEGLMNSAPASKPRPSRLRHQAMRMAVSSFSGPAVIRT